MSTIESGPDADADLATVAASAAAPGALKAGMHAPLFVLPDTAGQAVSLEKLLREGPVLLHFYRGAWCTYGEQSLADFGATYEQVAALGAQALAISPDRRTGQSPSLWPVPDLYDEGLRVARSYGLVYTLPERLQARYRELGYAPGEGCEWLAPLPAVYLLDRDGMVVLALLELDYRNRFNPEPLLHALRAIQSRRTARPRLF